MSRRELAMAVAGKALGLGAAAATRLLALADGPAQVWGPLLADTTVSSSGGKWRFRVGPADWAGMGLVKHPRRLDQALGQPTGAEKIIASATRLGTVIGGPWARLEAFDISGRRTFAQVSTHLNPAQRLWRRCRQDHGTTAEPSAVRHRVERCGPLMIADRRVQITWRRGQ